jgi:hypothetical protein
MPFYDDTSQIYTPEEVALLRQCYAEAATRLRVAGSNFSQADLGTAILHFAQSGLTDSTRIADLAARRAEKLYISSSKHVEAIIADDIFPLNATR